MKHSNTQSLSPEDVASWLVGRDWARVSKAQGVAALWLRGADEVLQPLVPNARDYESRIDDLLATVSRVERVDRGQVTQEIESEGSDLCEWIGGINEHESSVALEDGFKLVGGARNAFISAANASISRRGYFGHSSLKVAREHAKFVRMGHTRRGSYVVPILSRIPGATLSPSDDRPMLDVDMIEQPFARRVMAQLATGLTALQALAVTSDRLPTQVAIVESVGSGVSFELCRAISETLSGDSFSDLHMAFKWARRVPGAPPVTRVEFPEDAKRAVDHVAEYLRNADVIAEQTVHGFVRGHRLERGAPTGTVTIRASFGATARLVNVELKRDQVHEALQAADQDRPVDITGRLVRVAGKSWHFSTVSAFEVQDFIPTSSAE